jgi:DNA-binding CsgD family transcriptional regulator
MTDAANDPLQLTPRQRDILDLLAEGLTAVETATVLGIAPRTVRAHCETLRRKLNVNRTRRLPAAYRTLTSGAGAALEVVVAGAAVDELTALAAGLQLVVAAVTVHLCRATEAVRGDVVRP